MCSLLPLILRMMTPRYDGDGRLSSSSLYIIGIYQSAEDVKWAKMTPQLLMNLHSRAMCVFCNHHLQHQTRRRRDNQTQCQPTLFLSIIIISFHSIFLWLYYEKLIMIWWQQKKKIKIKIIYFVWGFSMLLLLFSWGSNTWSWLTSIVQCTTQFLQLQSILLSHVATTRAREGRGGSTAT